MNKTKKLFFTGVFLALIIVTVMACMASVSAEAHNGKCGFNLEWSYNTTNRELIISGTGDMDDYSRSSQAPWYSYRNSIETITIEDGVTGIGDFAFFECKYLTNVKIPDSMSSIGENAFADARLGNLYIEDLKAWCEISFDDTFANPMHCARNFYLNEVAVSELVLPTGTEKIGDYAFYGNKAITSVTIPDQVTSIGNSAFRGCISLTSASIGNGVISIGDEAFWGCALTSITLPNTLTSIGKEAFSANDFTNITIPNGVTQINDGVFADCDYLTNITLPNGIKSIGKEAFHNCDKLASITLPQGLTTISWYSFGSCISLANVTIPDSVTTIEQLAFFNCKAFTDITIPSSVTSIGSSAFEECSNLKTITYCGTESEWLKITNGFSVLGTNQTNNSCTINYTESEKDGEGEKNGVASFLQGCGSTVIGSISLVSIVTLAAFSIFKKKED